MADELTDGALPLGVAVARVELWPLLSVMAADSQIRMTEPYLRNAYIGVSTDPAVSAPDRRSRVSRRNSSGGAWSTVERRSG